MTRLAFLTIGQSPRPDLSAVVERALPAGVEVAHLGALDGLARAEINERFAARAGRATLISKLADGAVVTLDADMVGARLQSCIDQLEERGADIIVLLCTGEFPGLTARRAMIIEPDSVVCKTVQGLVRGQQAGIILPLPEQVDAAREKWAGLGAPPIFAFASPYEEGAQPLLKAAGALEAQGAQALVLDCMGYAPAHKQALREAEVTLPVMVSGGVLAAALGAFM